MEKNLSRSSMGIYSNSLSICFVQTTKFVTRRWIRDWKCVHHVFGDLRMKFFNSKRGECQNLSHERGMCQVSQWEHFLVYEGLRSFKNFVLIWEGKKWSPNSFSVTSGILSAYGYEGLRESPNLRRHRCPHGASSGRGNHPSSL
jgi:hypothetical protein